MSMMDVDRQSWILGPMYDMHSGQLLVSTALAICCRLVLHAYLFVVAQVYKGQQRLILSGDDCMQFSQQTQLLYMFVLCHPSFVCYRLNGRGHFSVRCTYCPGVHNCMSKLGSGKMHVCSKPCVIFVCLSPGAASC